MGIVTAYRPRREDTRDIAITPTAMTVRFE
jgi:hypothetical protein